MPQVEALIVVCVPSDATGGYLVDHCLGSEFQGEYPLLQMSMGTQNRNITLHIQSSDSLQETVIEAADGLILILDGELGLDPASMSIWSKATDLSIPRHIGAVRVTNGRADFDELIAIATRVLEPDLMVRYLPIDSETDDTVVGQYDLLTADIHDCSTGFPVIRHGDPEHVALTSDRRDDLFEELAHAGLADDSLESHRQGLPVSIPSLVDAWSDEHIVSITALDNQVGVHILFEWMRTIPARWIPAVSRSHVSTSVYEDASFIGIGIGHNIARVWGRFERGEALEVLCGELVEPITVECHTTGVLMANEIRFGCTVRPVGSDAEISVPRF